MKKVHFAEMYVAVFEVADAEMVKWESLSPTKKRCLEIMGNNAYTAIKHVGVAIVEMPAKKRKTIKRVAEAVAVLLNGLVL